MTAGDSACSAGDAPADAGARILSLQAAPTVGDLVATAVAAARRAAPDVRFTCDIDLRLGMHDDPRRLARLVEALVRQAVAAAAVTDPASDLPPLHEVVVTAFDSGAAVEIEVADSGAARAAVAADLQTMAVRLGGSLAVTACPEGGTAVTLRLPRRQSRAMAA